MAFGGEVQNGAGPVGGQELVDQGRSRSGGGVSPNLGLIAREIAQ